MISNVVNLKENRVLVSFGWKNENRDGESYRCFRDGDLKPFQCRDRGAWEDYTKERLDN